MKIRNKRTGEIREILENNLGQYGLGGKLNKLGVENSLWNNIRANRGSGKAPSKEMLKQERKIKAEYGGNVKYQIGGETLMSGKKVAEVETKLKYVNLRPEMKGYDKRVEKETYDPECPTGVGCSRYASKTAQEITGLPYTEYAPANAAYRDAVAKRTGLKEVFNQKDLAQRKNADITKPNWSQATQQDYDKWKAGDIVTLDHGGAEYFPYDAPKGYTGDDNTSTSHNGVVVGFDSGVPVISHGFTGRNPVPNKGKAYTEKLRYDGTLLSLGHGNFGVKSVWRPKNIKEDSSITSSRSIVETAEELATRKMKTTNNSSYSIDNKKADQMKQDYPGLYDFSGGSNRDETKKKMTELFNNKELDKELQYKLGMTAEELNRFKPVFYGVVGQESNFNDINSFGASLKETLGDIWNPEDRSKGPAQIKFNSLTEKERNVLGIKKPEDLNDLKNSYSAGILLLKNSKKIMDREVDKGTHPDLVDKDPYWRSTYAYNSPHRVLNTAEEWSNGRKPVIARDPSTYLNKLSTRQRDGIFANIDPNYVKEANLSMDENSYAYKTMKQAKDLKERVNLETPIDMEEVVTRSLRSKDGKSKLIRKQKGGRVKTYML